MLLKTKEHTLSADDSIEKAILELLKVSETEITEWFFMIKPHVVIGTHFSKLSPKRLDQYAFIKENTLSSCSCYHQKDGIIELQLKVKKKRTTRKKKTTKIEE